ncbi:type II secretion system F family protein [Thalassovita sp.]|uniref:type II secretion system F family protein n=1 Tax=Thalassovita sp. TaxID=1979401 RepID=UPI002B26F56B|nr:type II secretion system F family protein [Thalassovita sp.]
MIDILHTLHVSNIDVAIFVTVSVLIAGMLFQSNSEKGRGALLRRRYNRVTGKEENARMMSASDPIDAELRRRQIRSAMKHKDKNSGPTIRAKLHQAGLKWSMPKYVVITLLAIVAVWGGLMLVVGKNPLLLFLVAIPLGAILPYFYVLRTLKKRLKKFANEFPSALDIIVRGVSAGLPLSECLKTIANEAREPVRSEFNQLLNDQSVGIPLEKAVHRLAVRVPLPETSFFAIVLAVQSRSGGSLSEILTNLSSVVRGRKMLDAQIQTMSAEAKMSGRLIGAMPLLVAASLFYLSPDYITILTSTSVGNLILAGCVFWMSSGVMVMKKMINFKV